MPTRLFSLSRMLLVALLATVSCVAVASEAQLVRPMAGLNAYRVAAYVDGYLVADTTVTIPDENKLLSRGDFHLSGSSISWDDCDIRRPANCGTDIPNIEFVGRIEPKDRTPIRLIVRLDESLVNPIDLTSRSHQSLSYDDYISVRPGETWTYHEGPHLSVTVERLAERQAPSANTPSSLGYYGVDSLPAGAQRTDVPASEWTPAGDSFASAEWLLQAKRDGR
jgi:hypothetical protein